PMIGRLGWERRSDESLAPGSVAEPACPSPTPSSSPSGAAAASPTASPCLDDDRNDGIKKPAPRVQGAGSWSCSEPALALLLGLLSGQLLRELLLLSGQLLLLARQLLLLILELRLGVRLLLSTLLLSVRVLLG